MHRMNVWSVGIVSLLFASCLAAPQNPDDDLDKLISEVFSRPPEGTPPSGNGDSSGIPTALPNDLSNKNKSPCVCVPYYLCNVNGTIQEDGAGVIDIRVKEDECEGALDTCCVPPDIRPTENKITPPPTMRTGCGQRHPNGVGFRITGALDNEAQFGEFPWMVAIMVPREIRGKVTNLYECGGALIHPSVVLTAAHCVKGKDPQFLQARAGEWDTQTKSEIFAHQDRAVQRIIIHPNFKAGSLHNDFALLILASPMEIAENVDIVCLPDANAVFDGSRCFASGWGKDVFGKEGVYQVILKRVELPIVPQAICQDALRTTRLRQYFRLHESFICAGGEPGKDTCKGDGGSPLVCPLRNDPSRYVQAGIVSWGIGCGENQIPGVYANVAYARPWIDEVMALNNLDNTVYQYNPIYVF